ncbi:hypothetical protein FHS57_005895 [Runella defluvii]|jgi:hypothetical protein|uniref:DUF1896 family protein n=1 Tax=Runella defluvii TaxID=370973 RepID=A0A7W5ZS32_9BACT|nr:DUF1896 family protein [Runella defluvii]MBB3841866.1 hypothetical protein [Runella defluvii]
MQQDYFTIYLQSYLQSDFSDVLAKLTTEEIENLVSERVNQAASIFEQERLAGKDILQAQEVAIAELTNGLSFSTYSFLNNLLETEFLSDYQRLTASEKRQTFLIAICPLLENLVKKHEESDTGENQRLCYHLIISQLENLIQTHGV